ncbi:hypothetical protein RI543_002420 [Arxiozyma heterogenica]|uniref:Cyclin-like domain-containing protein n=1 Tax=Arxiozyma heterogenica TaxID=278026 RepID=A0AAN7ZXU5_9SACH|nr:hypothetical protein RI543_002420 [Kazachstania heterogenica]
MSSISAEKDTTTVSEDTNTGVTNIPNQNELSSNKEEIKRPKRVTDDDLYRRSSQYRLWSFTTDSLREKRFLVNENATLKVKDSLNKFIEDKQNSLSDIEIQTIKSKAVPVTPDEELKLVSFYAKKVQMIAQHLNLPTEVVATSIIFFKRFFLENSVTEFDPKDLVHTTIFLACKSENYFISVDSFAKKAKSKRDEILKYEFKLLESLKFTLLNHHPYKPLHGFYLDIQNVLHGKVDLNYMGKIYDKCKKKITDALLTDVVYHFTPPQITLAVFLNEDEQLIRRYLELKFSSTETNQFTDSTTTATTNNNNNNNNNANITENDDKKNGNKDEENKINLESLLNIILDCKKMIASYQTISTQDAKLIYAKIYYCKNPNVIVQKLKRKLEQASDGNSNKNTEHVDKKQST